MVVFLSKISELLLKMEILTIRELASHDVPTCSDQKAQAHKEG